MTFEYVSVAEAMQRGGLRMVVVGGVPSPWGEAAKGILHIKGIAWVAVRHGYRRRRYGGRSCGRRNSSVRSAVGSDDHIGDS